MYKNYKNSNGITLVALIVTIVVLLILVGISINIALGENGIITKTGDAKNNTEQKSAEEKVSLILGNWAIEKHTGTMTLE